MKVDYNVKLNSTLIKQPCSGGDRCKQNKIDSMKKNLNHKEQLFFYAMMYQKEFLKM